MMAAREYPRGREVVGLIEDMTALGDESPYLVDWRSLNAQAPRQCPGCGTVYGVSIADVVTGGNRCPWCGQTGGVIVGGRER